jgi:multidrug efflux pump
VLVSGFVALTLSPMMSSRLLRAGDPERGFAGWINRRFDRIRKGYVRFLTATLQWRPVTLTFAALFTLLIVPFYLISMKELAPKEDQGVILGIVQAAPNATIDQTSRFTAKVNDVFKSMPETAETFQITDPTFGFSGMVTKPWSDRSRSTEQIVGEVFGKVSAIPGVRVIATTPEPLPGGSQFPIEFVINSTAEPRVIYDFANQFVQTALDSKLFMFADTDLKYDQPQTEIVFDRDKVALLGVNLSQVGSDLGTMLGGNYVNRFSNGGRSYKVIPEVKRNARLNVDQLKNYYVSAAGGKLVPLSTFATLKTTTEPRTLNRFQQLNSAKIQGAIPPGVTQDQALKVLEEEAAKVLPKGFTIDYGGSSRQLRVEGNKLLETFALSVVLIFLVLAAQFESFRDPLIILLGSVPLALAGALLPAFLGFTTINIYSQVGLITLVGLVSKNGILIVEFANKLQDSGLDRLSAVIEAAGTRLRPILMTSVATVMGHFPLVLASGPGAGSRNSIGYVLVTGMIVGTLFTLFVVPSIYMVIARDRRAEEDDLLDEIAIEPVGV